MTTKASDATIEVMAASVNMHVDEMIKRGVICSGDRTRVLRAAIDASARKNLSLVKSFDMSFDLDKAVVKCFEFGRGGHMSAAEICACLAERGFEINCDRAGMTRVGRVMSRFGVKRTHTTGNVRVYIGVRCK